MTDTIEVKEFLRIVLPKYSMLKRAVKAARRAGSDTFGGKAKTVRELLCECGRQFEALPYPNSWLNRNPRPLNRRKDVHKIRKLTKGIKKMSCQMQLKWEDPGLEKDLLVFYKNTANSPDTITGDELKAYVRPIIRNACKGRVTLVSAQRSLPGH